MLDLFNEILAELLLTPEVFIKILEENVLILDVFFDMLAKLMPTP